MTSSEFRIASISDIHLGHQRNKTGFIINNLYKAFPDNAKTAVLDVISIGGDLFDRMLSLPDDDVRLFIEWAVSFLKMCKRLDIAVWLLEGTPSHDRAQPSLMVTLNTVGSIGCDLLYVDTLSVVHIDKFAIDVLFVPDVCRPTAEEILHDTKAIMASKGLTKVDYAIMHGQFAHQLPEVVKAPKHDAQEYLALVDKLIFIGHVHNYSAFERIYANGSFDRCGHGEEHPKGHLRATVKSAKDYRVQFVENAGALIFRTVECRALGLDESLSEIEKQISGLPVGSFVRVKCSKVNPVISDMALLERRWPLYVWSKLVVDEDEEVLAFETLSEDDKFIPIEITKDNILDLSVAKMLTTTLDTDLVYRAEAKLRQLR